MIDPVYTVLFLCTGNPDRSIFGEAILHREGGGRFRAFSAGSHPKSAVHPYALNSLRQLNLPRECFKAKSWDEFATAQAPVLDFVFTVCDDAALEPCPVWPGQPMSAHWGIPDPVVTTGNEAEKRLAFGDAYRMLKNRISAFTSLPIALLDHLSLRNKYAEIGRL